MNLSDLNKVALAMVTPGKGLLAADESSGTIKKRFDAIKVDSTEDTIMPLFPQERGEREAFPLMPPSGSLTRPGGRVRPCRSVWPSRLWSGPS